MKSGRPYINKMRLTKIEITEKNQTGTLELKTTMNEVKNAIKSIDSTTDQAKEKKSVNSKMGHLKLSSKRTKKRE